jgi:hypothetical protein
VKQPEEIQLVTGIQSRNDIIGGDDCVAFITSFLSAFHIYSGT